MSTDRRMARRTQLGRRCWIAIGPQQPPIECEICDISETGAKIAGQVNLELPQELELLLTANGNVRRGCTIVWQAQNELGVRFLGRRRRTRTAAVQQPN